MISYDKKQVEKIAQSCGIDKIMAEDLFRLGKLDEAAQKTGPIVVKLTNPWNYRLLLMSNKKFATNRKSILFERRLGERKTT